MDRHQNDDDQQQRIPWSASRLAWEEAALGNPFNLTLFSNLISSKENKFDKIGIENVLVICTKQIKKAKLYFWIFLAK